MRKYLSHKDKIAIGDHCANCGRPDDLQYHHIVPLAFGGNDTAENMVCLCSECHSMIHHGRNGAIAHNEAVKSGIHAAIARGVHFGKKSIISAEKIKFVALHSTQFNPRGTMTEPEIRDALGVSNTTYHKIKCMLIAAMNADKWPYDFEKPTHCKPHADYEWVLKARRAK